MGHRERDRGQRRDDQADRRQHLRRATVALVHHRGDEQPILGGDSYDDPGLFQALGPEYGNDIVFASHTWVSPDTSPQMAEFLKLKRKYDPDELYQSEWYRHYTAMFADRI